MIDWNGLHKGKTVRTDKYHVSFASEVVEA